MCAHVGSVGSWVVVDAQSSSVFNVPIQYLQMLRKHRRLASEQSKKKKLRFVQAYVMLLLPRQQLLNFFETASGSSKLAGVTAS
jgi:hypothetical protein